MKVEELIKEINRLKAENKKLDKNWMNAVHRNVAAEKKFKSLLKELNELVEEANNAFMTKQELQFAIEVLVLTYMEI